MPNETPAKPDVEAPKTETDQPESGVTIRSTDAADDAPAIELTETDEERTTREASESEAIDDTGKLLEDDEVGGEDDATGSDAGETTDTAETETEDEIAAKTTEGDEKPAKPKRHRPRAQERINEALRERYRADARAEVLDRENKALKAAAEEPAPAVPGKDDTPDATPPRPVQEEFNGTYEDFLQADNKWQIDEGIRLGLRSASADIRKEVLDEIKADRDKQAADAQLQVEASARADYDQRIDETRAAIPDFDEVIEKSGDIPISPPMREALQATPAAGTILYHLAKNPTLCAEMAEMPPGQAIYAMGRLEAQLEATAGGAPGAQAPKTTARTKRRLPTPVSPVGGSSVATTVDPDKLPYQQYKAYREKQERTAAGR